MNFKKIIGVSGVLLALVSSGSSFYTASALQLSPQQSVLQEDSNMVKFNGRLAVVTVSSNNAIENQVNKLNISYNIPEGRDNYPSDFDHVISVRIKNGKFTGDTTAADKTIISESSFYMESKNISNFSIDYTPTSSKNVVFEVQYVGASHDENMMDAFHNDLVVPVVNS